MELSNPLYQRDIYFNRYRSAHQIYGVFLSHFPKPYIWSGSGRTLPAYFSHLCSWLFRNLCRNSDDSLPQCCQPSCSGQKKRSPPASLYRTSHHVVRLLLFYNFSAKIRAILAGSVLGDRRCEHLLILLSYVFPFSAIHSCITGYCLGLKDTKIPSSSQLLEQTVRIFSVLVICQFLNHTEGSSGIWIAVLGLIFGEIASALYSLKCVRNKPGLHFLIPSSLSLQQMFSDAKELIKLSLPLTGNRILLNILQSIEAVSIPASLLIYGLSTSDALSTYGVLTGMALPCILFPSALTNSASTMLLPAITEAQTQKNVQRIKKMIRSSLCGCIFLGTGCLAGFFLLGPVLGRLLFHSSLAGEFIRTLSWMCPFLYANSALISIIHGLGKTGISFLLNTLSLFIRIIGVLYFTVYFGIPGYLHCLLASQIFLFVTGILYISYHLRQMLLISHYNT